VQRPTTSFEAIWGLCRVAEATSVRPRTSVWRTIIPTRRSHTLYYPLRRRGTGTSCAASTRCSSKGRTTPAVRLRWMPATTRSPARLSPAPAAGNGRIRGRFPNPEFGTRPRHSRHRRHRAIRIAASSPKADTHTPKWVLCTTDAPPVTATAEAKKGDQSFKFGSMPPRFLPPSPWSWRKDPAV
jgi:hypothetical protein